MKQDTINNFKAKAFDYIFKGLVGLICLQVKEIREDIKELMKTVPALQAKVDMLTDQRLIDRFKILETPPAKDEEIITYDSLTKKN